MRGFYVIHDQAGYDAWMAERVAEMMEDQALQAPPATDTTATDTTSVTPEH
jgi:hypothetical protein